MKTKSLTLLLIVAAIPAWGGPRVGLGTAVARQAGEVIKEERAKREALPVCTEEASYSVSPIDPALPFNMEPLGHMSGASHLFPTDHVYFIIQKDTSAVITTDVFAPADMEINSVASFEYLNAVPAFTDYSVGFSPCQGLKGVFGHIAELSESIAAAISAIPADCHDYTDGSVRYCSRNISVRVSAGERIGNFRGRVGSSIYSLDLGAHDYRKPPLDFIDPVRRYGDYLYTVCPFDEYEEPLRSLILARMGNYDGTIDRTAEPLCGTILEDVAGKAQGLWYVAGTPAESVQMENSHLALVHDNVSPSTGVFSTGTAIQEATGLGAQQYYFNPQNSGLINRDFDQVRPSAIYCYDSFSNQMNNIILIQMPSSATLKIEPQAGASCGAGPWFFNGSEVSFIR